MMEHDFFFLTKSGDTATLTHTWEDCILLFIKKKRAIVSLIVTDHFMEEFPTVLAVVREFASTPVPVTTADIVR